MHAFQSSGLRALQRLLIHPVVSVHRFGDYQRRRNRYGCSYHRFGGSSSCSSSGSNSSSSSSSSSSSDGGGGSSGDGSTAVCQQIINEIQDTVLRVETHSLRYVRY